MKEVFIVIIILMTCCGVSLAQGLSEWIDQKRTEIKYMKAQIAALTAYSKLMEKGYQIAGKGLSIINDVKQADVDQHQEHIASLSSVKPVIRDDPRVKAAYDLAIRIRKIAEQLAAYPVNLGLPFTRIAANLNLICNQGEDCLGDVTEDGLLQMTDDDRLRIIDQVYQSMKEAYLQAQKALKEISANTKNGL